MWVSGVLELGRVAMAGLVCITCKSHEHFSRSAWSIGILDQSYLSLADLYIMIAMRRVLFFGERTLNSAQHCEETCTFSLYPYQRPLRCRKVTILLPEKIIWLELWEPLKP